MPVYLFTYHAYGSWLPDRRQGYVKRKRGILPSDQEEAARYRNAMLEEEVTLRPEHQRLLLVTLLESQEKQRFFTHGVATDATHLHTLVSWADDRRVVPVRSRIKSSLSRAMNGEFGKREWLSEGGSRRRVREQTHFDHLLARYLPKHSGLVWIEGKGSL